MLAAAPTKRARRLEIGRVGAPHGLAGEVRVSLHFEGSDALDHVETVVAVTDQGERVLALRGVRPNGRFMLVAFEGVADRDAALALRGARLEVERDRLPPLAEGEYYLADLVGAIVVGPEGPIGEVTGIANHPTVSSVEVKLHDGRRGEQLLDGPWLKRIDVASGTIELASLDGLVV